MVGQPPPPPILLSRQWFLSGTTLFKLFRCIMFPLKKMVLCFHLFSNFAHSVGNWHFVPIWSFQLCSFWQFCLDATCEVEWAPLILVGQLSREISLHRKVKVKVNKMEVKVKNMDMKVNTVEVKTWKWKQHVRWSKLVSVWSANFHARLL